jgi:hypothetical protein
VTEKICLALVRHGETVGNSSIRYYGRTDLALSDLGRAQMRGAALTLAGLLGARPLTRVFASPLIRAQEGLGLLPAILPQSAKLRNFAKLILELSKGSQPPRSRRDCRANSRAGIVIVLPPTTPIPMEKVAPPSTPEWNAASSGFCRY